MTWLVNNFEPLISSHSIVTPDWSKNLVPQGPFSELCENLNFSRTPPPNYHKIRG